jgi:hypothetical protein
MKAIATTAAAVGLMVFVSVGHADKGDGRGAPAVCSDGSGFDVDATAMNAFAVPSVTTVSASTASLGAGICAYVNTFIGPVGVPAVGPEYVFAFGVTDVGAPRISAATGLDVHDVYIVIGPPVVLPNEPIGGGSLIGDVLGQAVGFVADVGAFVGADGERSVVGPGDTYYLIVDNTGGASGSFSIEVTIDELCSDASGLQVDGGAISPYAPGAINFADPDGQGDGGLCGYFDADGTQLGPAAPGPDTIFRFEVSEPVTARVLFAEGDGVFDVWLTDGTAAPFVRQVGPDVENVGLVSTRAIAYAGAADAPLVDASGQQPELQPGTSYYLCIDSTTGSPAAYDFDLILTPAASGCNEDITGDGVIDVLDLNRVLAAFNQPANVDPPADISGDGTIDVLDLNALLGLFNEPCP